MRNTANKKNTFTKIEGHKKTRKIADSKIYRCIHCKQTGTRYQMYDQKCY